MLKKIIFLLLSVTFFSTNILAEEVKKKLYYYPKAKKTVALSHENYQKVNKSLKGLTAVYINLDSYLKGSKSRNMKIGFDMKKKVIAILKKHNIKLLDKQSIKYKFGQPTISISASFPAFLGPYKKGEKKKSYDAKCCTASVSASLKEATTLLRNPNINMMLTTWKTAQRTTDCKKLDTWFPKAVVKVVEQFVKDKAKVEKKKVAPKKIVKKKIVKKQVVKTNNQYYTTHSSMQRKPIVKKVVAKKVVAKKVKKVVQTYPSRTYYNVPSTKKVQVKRVPTVTKVVSVQAPVVQKELICSNSIPLTTLDTVIEGEELYRKVVRYERVHPQQAIVKYEVVNPVQTVIVEEIKTSRTCDSVLTMDMEIFKTGSSRIVASKYSLLDGFVNQIERCNNYKYTIETHADGRGSHAYNDKLTKDRATSIANYLLSRGISSSRFKMQSFGKRRPINFGTSLSDYSKNRRVVMIPHKINN